MVVYPIPLVRCATVQTKVREVLWAQGVQQPYEIQVLLGLDEYEVNLQARAYPNPTINELHLTLGNLNPKGVSLSII